MILVKLQRKEQSTSAKLQLTPGNFLDSIYTQVCKDLSIQSQPWGLLLTGHLQSSPPQLAFIKWTHSRKNIDLKIAIPCQP